MGGQKLLEAAFFFQQFIQVFCWEAKNCLRQCSFSNSLLRYSVGRSKTAEAGFFFQKCIQYSFGRSKTRCFLVIAVFGLYMHDLHLHGARYIWVCGQLMAIMFEADPEIESKLTGILKSHFSAWEHIGAGEFALSVIKNGYIQKLGAMPTFYAEPNNKSYHENVDFANDAVMELLNAGVVEEVQRSSLRCVNPLTVAQNTAKKRLCIDLSRCFNMQCKAQKYKIESTAQALASIDPDDNMFSFDLKSAYLQVPVNSNYWPYLGFSIKTSSNKGMQELNFWYNMLPFGLNDAARVLTKLLRSPIKHWRSQGISVFLHIDDGFSCANSREQALNNSNTVRSDLISLGLLISEEKCSWGARKQLEWTGFLWETVRFQLTVTDRKIENAAALLSEL